MLPLGRGAWHRYNWMCSLCRGLNKGPPRPDRRLHTGKLSSREEQKLNRKLPDTPARTRFAPSPTGYLHLGSLRTALYNYLLAKATGGQFLLRIEDTDAKRTVSGAEERICQDLEWAGLQWDEGPKVGGSYGPYRQSERTMLYKEHAEKLIESRSAYRCFCSKECVDLLAKEANSLGEATYNDSTCMGIHYDESTERASNGEAYVIRLKTPAVLPEYKDLVYGRVGRSQKSHQSAALKERLENPILMKSDGLPTYHLANVVDDHYMNITHVIRGVEWMSSTPKHLELYRAFGWNPPAFAHVGLLQDASRQKMSKRDLSANMDVMKSDGIFPEALLNFVALLGWSHSRGTDFMTIEQLVEEFDLKFSKGNVVVNFPKLDYLHKQHFQRYVDEGGDHFEAIVDQLLVLIKESTKSGEIPDAPNGRTMREFIVALLRAGKINQSTPKEFFERHKHLLGIKGPESRKVGGWLQDRAQAEVYLVANAAQQLAGVPEKEWSAAVLKRKVATIVEELSEMAKRESEGVELLGGEKYANSTFLSWLRWAIVDGQPGLGIFSVMELLGRSVTMARLSEAYGLLEKSKDDSSPSRVSDPAQI